MSGAIALMSPRKASAIGALLVALGPISMALYTPAMPQLVEVFGTDVATVKLTLTVYFLGFALAQLVCGPLSDAYGRRPIVMGFTAAYLVGSLLAVFAPSVEWLLAARVIQGIGASAGVAISRAIVRDLFTGRQSVQVMNMIGLMLAAGPALSPTIGGITLDLFGWHAIFLVMVIYGAVLIAIFATLVPETNARPEPARAAPRALAASYGALLTDRRFLRPTIIMASSVGALYTLATILPFVLIGRVGLTPTEFGVGMLAQSGSFMLGSLVMNRLLRSIEAHRLVPVGLALIGIGAFTLAILGIAAEPSFLTVMGPIGVFAFGIPFVMPSMLTESLAPFPRMAGAASALSGFFQMGGGLIGSAVAAAMGDPELALATIVPVMATIGIGTHVALRGATTRMSEEAADRLIEPRAPAE
jgi:DHA1 family bicyclomycin/chloramphenicol resistance-like MFS transporter